MYELEKSDINKELLREIGNEILKYEVRCFHKDKNTSVNEIKKIIEAKCNDN